MSEGLLLSQEGLGLSTPEGLGLSVIKTLNLWKPRWERRR